LLENNDPRSFVLSLPEKAVSRRVYTQDEEMHGAPSAEAALKRAIAAVRASATENREAGMNVGYLESREDWGPKNWWSARVFCNLDPDIAEGLGRYLLGSLERSFPKAPRSTGYTGIAIDNYFVDADTLDSRRGHFVSVDAPLVFAHKDLRPAILGDFTLFKWVKELSKRLHRVDGLLAANTVGIRYPFAMSLIDIHFHQWGIEKEAALSRALAYRKPVLSTPEKPEHVLDDFLRLHVRWGFVPGVEFQTGASSIDVETLRASYRRLLPALVRAARSGWEPVPWAFSENGQVQVERFGGSGRALLLSVMGGPGQRTRVRLSPKQLDLPLADRWSSDLLGGNSVAWGVEGNELVADIELPASGMRMLDFSIR